MFKQTLILAAVIGCAMSFTIPERYQPMAKEILENCAETTNTDIKFILRLREGNDLPAIGSEDEAKYKAYNHCGFIHTGVFKDGVFQDAVADKLIEGLQEIYNKPLLKCKGERAENDVETAWKITRCFYDHLEDKKHFFLY